MKFQFLITVEPEYWPYPTTLAVTMREALRVEFAKKKHAGKVKVSVRTAGRLEGAIWNLVQEIEETATDAANARFDQ